MAAVEVTISGVLYDKLSRTTRPCVLIGEASLTGLEIGGGPIQPPAGGPPGVWPPPRPSHPIVGPGDPSWGGGGQGPVDPGYGYPIERPSHPIALPPIPTEPPPDGGDKPPPEGSGGWGFVAEWSRWGFFPPPTEAQPKA